MYEQYTDKQIVEMLVPKLSKILGNGMLDTALEHSESGRNLIELIATIYRLAYIRGQLGRSFIIGEPKHIKRWVPATKSNLSKGTKVRYLNAKMHKKSPECYPAQGTVGEVVAVGDNSICLVQWPGYTNVWYVTWLDLEVLLCE